MTILYYSKVNGQVVSSIIYFMKVLPNYLEFVIKSFPNIFRLFFLLYILYLSI